MASSPVTAATAAEMKSFMQQQWDTSVVPLMTEYIKIPNQSPDYDPEWATNGLMEKAMDLLVDWVRAQPVKGMAIDLIKDEGMTPFLLIEIDEFDPAAPVAPAAVDEAVKRSRPAVLMYGHMDKQPPLEQSLWAEGLGPYTPVLRDGRLYGRGGADDGYAICASLLSVIACQKFGIAHRRTCVIIEASEESGESHLEHYIRKLQPRFGNVTLVVCLDSCALSYDRLWLTASLRGVIGANIKVELLREGVHSGVFGGAVADSFRVARQLLDRVENTATGEVRLPEMHCEIPAGARDRMGAMNDIPVAEWREQYPLLPGVAPEPGDNVALALASWWKPTMTVIGAGGLPSLADAGNVLRQSTTIRVSMRMPPLVDATKAGEALAKVLTTDVPYGAKVTVDVDDCSDGWAAPPLAPWLENSLEAGSQEYFGRGFAMLGIGGSIPFMGMLGEMFPQAQFCVTGVLGPNSNAHGPNEFLDVACGKGVNFCMARIVADHFVASV